MDINASNCNNRGTCIHVHVHVHSYLIVCGGYMLWSRLIFFFMISLVIKMILSKKLDLTSNSNNS